MNLFLLSRDAACDDCGRAYGFPLTFFFVGGEVGIREFMRGGLVVNLLVLVAFAGALAWTWKRFTNRTQLIRTIVEVV
jgi:hypothetical protein